MSPWHEVPQNFGVWKSEYFLVPSAASPVLTNVWAANRRAQTQPHARADAASPATG